MAAPLKALNARIRANPVLDYFCSTHFWGPVSNFGIPVAAVMDIFGKDPEIISGNMTVTLTCYSAVFMRYAMAVTPKNYLLFGCHLINFTSQSAQGYRYWNYHYNGGKERRQAEAAGGAIGQAAEEVKGKVGEAVEKVKGAVSPK